MRATLNIPDDVYRAAQSLAAAQGIPLGEALAELVRQGLRTAAQADTQKAFPCFVAPERAKPITLEQTLDAEDDQAGYFPP